MKKNMHPRCTQCNQVGKSCKLKHNEANNSGFGQNEETGMYFSLRITG
jgi:hypothetical protein